MSELENKIEGIKTKIGEIYYEKEKGLYKQEYDEKIGNYSRGSVISDLANTEDKFDRRERARTLAQVILDKEIQTPFNIGIFAHWGVGKTTFLSYLQEEIECFNKNENNKRNGELITYIVNYDASEYEEKDKIWASILRTMFLQYEKTTWFPKFFYTVKKILSNRKKFTTFILSYILSLLIVSGLSAYSLYMFWNDWNKQLKIITGSGATIIAIIILITKLLIPSIKGLLQSAIPLSDKIVNNISLPDYVNKLGARENIKKDLSILVDAWLHRWGNDNKRIVLIIDELDRCSVKGITEFFQSMQLFLKVHEIVIIFAIDQGYLKKALSNSFGLTDEKEINIFLMEYLEKYINVSIYLNQQVNYLTYIDYLLNNINNNGNNFALSDGEKQSIKSIIGTVPINFLTPRKVKKLINVLIISKETCVLFNKKGGDIIDFRGYILWFIFTCFYAEEVKQMHNYFEAYKYNKYYKVRDLLYKMPKKSKEELLIKVNNQQILELMDEIVLKDIYNYDSVISDFAQII